MDLTPGFSRCNFHLVAIVDISNAIACTLLFLEADTPEKKLQEKKSLLLPEVPGIQAATRTLANQVAKPIAPQLSSLLLSYGKPGRSLLLEPHGTQAAPNPRS
jgi:hypothetical protein